MERLAEADERGAGHGRIVEPDDPLVEAGRIDEVGGGHQLGRVVEGGQAASRGSGPSWASVARRSNGGGGAVTIATVQEADGPGPDPNRLCSPAMCGRFTQQRPTSEIAAIFEAEDLVDDPGGRFNVAPTDEAAVVVQRDDRRAVVGYRWGLSRAGPTTRGSGRGCSTPAPRPSPTSPLFRDAFRRRRCLVPVDGFYEWLRDGTRRQPMRIHDPRIGRSASRACGPAGATRSRRPGRGTFTIVTTRPNEFMAGDPRPDAGRRAARRRGRPGSTRPRESPGELRALLEPRDDVELAAYPVPPLVNNVRNNGPELIEHAGPVEAQPSLP